MSSYTLSIPALCCLVMPSPVYFSRITYTITMLFPDPLCPVTTFPAPYCPILPCHTLFCHSLSFPTLPCSILSLPVLSSRTANHTLFCKLYPALACPVPPCAAQSCSSTLSWPQDTVYVALPTAGRIAVNSAGFSTARIAQIREGDMRTIYVVLRVTGAR